MGPCPELRAKRLLMYMRRYLVGFETLLMKLERGRVVVLRCAGSYFFPFLLRRGCKGEGYIRREGHTCIMYSVLLLLLAMQAQVTLTPERTQGLRGGGGGVRGKGGEM